MASKIPATAMRLNPQVKEFAQEEAKKQGLSMTRYVENLIRKEMWKQEKEAGN